MIHIGDTLAHPIAVHETARTWQQLMRTTSEARVVSMRKTHPYIRRRKEIKKTTTSNIIVFLSLHLLSLIKVFTDLTIGGGVAGQTPASLYCFEDSYIPPVKDPIRA
jgi:hypothetical protein